MAKAIIPVLDVLKGRIADMNQKLTSQYRMMQWLTIGTIYFSDGCTRHS